MRLLFLSGHAFLPSTRKASVHFVSEAFAKRGHSVAMVSVGYSLLTRLKDPGLYKSLASEQKNRFVERSPRYRTASYLPLLHPFSSGRRWLDWCMSIAFRLYGSILPRFIRNEVEAADVVFLESGTSICFFDAIRRANKNARIVYFCRDRLDTVGASSYLVASERRLARACDTVLVPSPRMAEHLPPEIKLAHAPQGIDKPAFDRCTVSPYPNRSRNAVAVGNMLFDSAAISAMARHNPDVAFHLFGNGMSGDYPSNVTVYGERPFGKMAPYIKFADFGIAPYRMTEKELYLAQSSLKLQQYSYCLLPIVAPDLLVGARDNVIPYDPASEERCGEVVRQALATERDQAWRDGILSWDEVCASIEEQLPRFPTRSDGSPAHPLPATAGWKVQHQSTGS